MKQFSKHFYVLLTCLLLAFAFCLPVQAAEEKEPTIIPLAQGETLSGSFSGNDSTEVYYLITITQKQAITIYGTQAVGEHLGISLYDQNMKYVSHKSLATTSANYKWRTDDLTPGNYYIGVSSPHAAMDYTITYDTSPCPTAIPLAYGQTLNGSLSSQGTDSAYYSITITQKQAITIYGTQTADTDMDITFYDQDMEYISSGSTQNNYRFRTDSLNPGNYYICVSTRNKAVDYTIAYDTSPYPNAILLERTQKASGKLASKQDKNTYKFVLPEPLPIIFDITKDKGPYLYLDLYDETGAHVDHNSSVTEEPDFLWGPGEKLPAGTYYLTVSGNANDVNYTIFWQIRGPYSVDNLRSSKTTTSTITLKWKKSAGASKYIVYMNPSKKKGYKKYKTVTSTTCKVKKLKAATKYKFKVIPVAKYGAEEIPGDEELIEIATAPKKVATPTVTFRSSGTLAGTAVNYYTVKWKKVKGAKGYEVYAKAHGTKGWKRLETTKSTSTAIYIVKGFSGQVKVRAYTKSDESYSYGAFSGVKTINSR